MKVTFKPTLEDVIETNLFHAHHSPTMKKQRFLISISMPMLVIMGVILLLLLGQSQFLETYYPLFIIFTVAYLIFAYFGYDNSIKRVSKNMFTEKKNDAIFAEGTMSIEDDHLLFVSSAGETKNRWTSVEEVHKNDNYIFIYVTGMNIHSVPKRAFSNDDEFEKFYHSLVEKVSHK